MTRGITAHSKLNLHPDASRTVIRPFSPEYPKAFAAEDHPRGQEIVDRILSLTEEEVQAHLKRVLDLLAERHRDCHDVLLRRFEEMTQSLDCSDVGPEQALLIGAYFSEEYSYEAAALFNPCMVLHGDQSGVPEGSIRFAMSLRGIGEGHVSSITFRTGIWGPANAIELDPPSRYGIAPRIDRTAEEGKSVRLTWETSEDLSETVIFPVMPSQSQGIEDLRLVRFIGEDGSETYYGTYTAFNGRDARSELLEGVDFKTFIMTPLEGDAAQGKGMALFPRLIGGRYAMLGRQDNENIWYLTSDDLYTWNGGKRLICPRYPWEFVQVGNCGSPIEIDEGWLVLTHGVGMVRNYCMGAALLDKDDPGKLLARTPRPILAPSRKQRDGYVPNVVYSCGGLVHDRTLLLPYGVADSFTAFASIDVDKLLAAME